MARILVVDDDGGIRSVVRFALESAGHDVEVATDGGAALARVATASPDAIVLDLMMPIVDGVAVLEHVAALPLEQRMPIVVLTARIDQAERIRSLGHRLLEKPFSPKALLRAVDAALGKPSNGHAAL